MRVAFILTVVVIVFLMGGCCKEVQITPDRPTSVRGWQEFTNSQGFHAIGEFLLKKGESVENVKFGVELVKTIAPQKCNEPFAENDTIARAVLRIYDVSSKRTLTEIEVRAGSTSRLINIGFPIEEYGLDTIFPRTINTKDEWIWIELWD